MTGASRDPGTSANFRYTTSTDMTGGELERASASSSGVARCQTVLADALVGIEEDLEQFGEQHNRCVGALGDVELALHERAASLGVLRGDAVVEQVDDLAP
jgi:hypothetical protein